MKLAILPDIHGNTIALEAVLADVAVAASGREACGRDDERPVYLSKEVGVKMVTREEIAEAVQAELEPLGFVNALWEAGSASFDRLDAFSDIDLVVDVVDGHVGETVAAVEEALTALSPIAEKYELPQPSWHGHYQAFIHLEKASKFLLIDYVVIENSSKAKFLEQEQHGTPVVYFDRANVVQSPPFDGEKHEAGMRQAFLELRARFPLFVDFAEKELLRGQPLDALTFYQGMQIRPLVMLLRMKYDPMRYSFGSRYLHRYLPAEEAGWLERLMFVGDAAELQGKIVEATEWCWELMEELG